MVRLVQQLLRSRMAWSVLDQVLFGISTFVVNIILARLLPSQEYGAFALGFSLLMLIGGFQAPLILEPLLIYSNSRFAEQTFNYQQMVMALNWWFTVPLGIMFGIASLFVADIHVKWMLWGLMLATPMVLYGWLMRRVCYANLWPMLSAQGGLVYMLVYLALIFTTYELRLLNLSVAYVLMGLASLASGVWILLGWRRIAQQKRQEETPSTDLRSQILKAHWEYGRWGLFSNLLYYVPVMFPYVLLSRLAGLEVTASLRALENFTMPVANLMGTLSSFLIPSFTRVAEDNAKLFRLSLRFAAMFLAFSLLMWLGLGLLHGHLFELFYPGHYHEASLLLWVLGLQPLFIGLHTVAFSALRAKQKPQLLTYAYVLGALFMLVVGSWAIARYGLVGAVWSMMLSQALLAVIAWLFTMPFIKPGPLVAKSEAR